MTPTSRVVRDEVDNLLAYLIDSEIALLTNPVRDEAGRISWHPYVAGRAFLENSDPPTLAGYRGWVASGHFSALLYDGALLQMTYDFAGHVIASHRLAWVPCPFAVDVDLLQNAPILEVVDMYADGRPVDVLLRTMIRFDFDQEAANSSHPATHLTINSRDCRIACAAPLRLGRFVEFVFRNFYPDIWRAHPYLSGISQSALADHTLTPIEAEAPHVSWPR
jgi:hypothetical protein